MKRYLNFSSTIHRLVKVKIRQLLILGTFLTLALLDGCKKEEDSIQAQPVASSSETISSELEEWFKGAPTEIPDLKKIKLPNDQSLYNFLLERDPAFIKALPGGRVGSGRIAQTMSEAGPHDKKNLLVGYMVAAGSQFATPKPYTDGDFVQDKLWYKDNGKDPNDLTPIKSGVCRVGKKIHGLDCSGMIYQMAKAAGLNIPVGRAQEQSQKEVWEKALSAAGDKYKKIEVKEYDYGKLNYSDLETGDIIFFRRNGAIHHAGVAYGSTDGTAMGILHSFGRSDREDRCDLNEEAERGPVAMRMSDIVTNFPGESIKVIRFVTDISGKYQIYLACQEYINDAPAAIFEITLPKEDDGKPIEATGSGIDYDSERSGFTIQFTGIRDSKKNLLSAQFLITGKGSPRKDSFSSIKLSDETDWITMTKVINNQGCIASVKLKNLEK